MHIKNRPACPPFEDDALTEALYSGILRPLLPLAASKAVSLAGGLFASSKASRGMIPGFIRKNNIDMSQFERRDFASFNDFFTRRALDGARPLEGDENMLISPCDSRVMYYEISDDLKFRIKGADYSIAGLLRNRELAEAFAGGICLVFRLSVDDLHRYIYFDSGSKDGNIRIAGKYYTVRPTALKAADFYKENTREYTVLHTDNFGTAVQVEIGATFVGRICNFHQKHEFKRGEEKGMFEFGGSTIVLLLKKGAAVIDWDIRRSSMRGLETKVRLGEGIGVKS